MSRILKPIAVGDFLACVSLIGLLALQLGTFADDPGVGWHLQTGRIVAQSGAVPRVDSLLASGAERAWVADQWLSDLVLYKLYQLGAWPLLYLVLILIYIGTYFVLLLPAVTRLTGFWLASVISVFMAFKIGMVHFILRPVIFTFPLFALLTIALFTGYRQIRSGGVRRVPTHLDFLPMLFVLWANVHASFLLGLAFLALLPISLLLDDYFGKAPSGIERSVIRRLALITALCAAATLANPYGWRLHQVSLSLLNSDFFRGLYQEWHSPDFKELPGRLVIVSLGVVALSAFVAGASRIGFFELLSILAASALALDASRNLPFFGIVMAVPVAESLQALCAQARVQSMPVLRLLSSPLSALERRERRAGAPVLFPVVILALLAVYAVSGRVMLFNGLYGPSERFPHNAIDRIPRSSVVASTLTWGGFIVNHDDLKAIIDDRSTVLGEAYYREYSRRMSPTSDWKQYLQERGATHLLLPPDSPIAVAARAEGFELLYADSVSTLFAVP